MGLLSSKRAAKKCAVCGGMVAEKMPAGDLCAECFQRCVNVSGILRYLQNTSIENLNAIQSAAVQNTAVQNQAAQSVQKTQAEAVVSAETPVQEKAVVHTYKIMRQKTGESFILFQQISKIGKSADMADIVITDNNTLSRCHATLEKTADGVVLADCGSKNGTRVGGERLAPGQKVLLHSGDTFMLSNETLILVSE